MSSKKNPEAEFAYGSGHLNPVKAANPGLVYDAEETDYVQFLCGQEYSNQSLQLLTGSNNGTVWDLNYPSFALSGLANKAVTRVFHWTVTNVGSPVSTYNATVVPPPGLTVKIEPGILSFNAVGQTQKFVLNVSGVINGNVLSGRLVWDDGVYQVRSPIIASALS